MEHILVLILPVEPAETDQNLCRNDRPQRPDTLLSAPGKYIYTHRICVYVYTLFGMIIDDDFFRHRLFESLQAGGWSCIDPDDYLPPASPSLHEWWPCLRKHRI